MKNISLILKTLVIIFCLLNIIKCTKLDEIQSKSGNENIFTKNSEIGTKILITVRMPDDPKDPKDSLQRIDCINFIYPLAIQIYDTNRNVVGIKTFFNDSQFSSFLGSLSNTQEISISYPISTTYQDGSVFTINNNNELKVAIDNCSEKEIIAYCNGLFCNGGSKYYWKIEYEENGDNKYLSGYFEPQPNGTVDFKYGNDIISGTWGFSILDSKLHLNINLAGINSIVTDLNIDNEIEIQADLIKIKKAKQIVLRRFVEKKKVYDIGSIGDAGGIVVYDKGSYSDGWRYIEVNPTVFNISQWGCINSNIIESQNHEIGKGFYNSGKILFTHDSMLNFYLNPSSCSSVSDGTVASKQALESILINKKGWFLPSIDELKLVYDNLQANNISNFGASIFWSSTQNNTSSVKCIDFSNGNELLSNKSANNKFLAIRYF